MTRIAIIGCIYMPGILATGGDTIVAGKAVADESTVINSSNLQPVSRVMAIIALKRRCYMPGGFSSCNNIVMAAVTYTNDFVMIHCAVCNRCPGSRS